MTPRFRLSPGAALAAALAVLAAGCSGSAAATKPAGPPAVPVAVATAVLKDVPERVEAVGSVEPLQTVSVKAQADGRVVAVRFAEGQSVRAGDLLFQIDPRPYEAALAQARGTLARDEVQAENAAADARRADALAAEGVLSKEQHELARATAASQRAAATANAAAVQSARLNLQYTQVRAPISGRTGAVLVRLGNVVKAGDDTPLVVINTIDPIAVGFALPEQRLGAVRGAQSGHSLLVEAVQSGVPGFPPQGRLTFIDNQVDRASGTIRLKATFPNGDGRLWPGQFVSARLTLGVRAGAVVIPSPAVQNGQQGSFVFVVKPDHTVEQRAVVTSPAGEGQALVERGVRAGETVVVDGQLGLTNGARVQVKPAAGSGAGAPAAARTGDAR